MTLDCPTAEFVGSSWRRDQHARRGSQHCMHCHSTVNARDCTLRPEWQCRPRGAARSGPSGSAPYTATRRRTHGLHALTLPLDVERTKTARSGPSGSAGHAGLHAQARVAVPLTLPLDVERTGCTPSHCHSTSNAPKRHARARVAVPTAQGCTLRAEWQCPSHCHSTSNARAARPHTATRRRAYQDGALGPEWQCRPRVAARSGPSGSADHAGLHAQGRVAVRVRVAYEPAVAAPMPGRASRTCLERVGLEPCSRRTLCGQWNVFLQGRSGWLCSWPARCSQPPLGGTTVPRCTTPHASAGHCPCHNACRPSRRASRAGTSPPTPHPRAHSARTPRSPRGPRCSLCAPCPRVRLHRCTPR